MPYNTTKVNMIETSLTNSALSEMQWWVENIHTAIILSIDPPPLPSYTILTDASKTGWHGVTKSGVRAGDIWSKTERQYHINYLGILAVYYFLKALQHLVAGLHIKILCDFTVQSITARYHRWLSHEMGLHFVSCPDMGRC